MANRTNARSEQVTIENIATFRRVKEPLQIYDIPESPQRRKLTDVSFLITFAICVFILLGFMIYGLCNSDIQRALHGVDACGNVCGSDNPPSSIPGCSGGDMSDKPYLVYKSLLPYFNELRPSHCASSCNSTYDVEFYRCYPRHYSDTTIRGVDFFTTTGAKLQDESTNLLILCFIGTCLSIVALICFRYFLKTFMFSMIVAYVLLLFAVTGFFWYLYSEEGQAFIGLAIIFTVLSLFFLIFVCVLLVRLPLVINFYQESIKIIFAMPIILLEPLLTFICNFIVLGLFVYTFLLMSTAGTLERNDETLTYEYVSNGFMLFPLWFSVIMAIWMFQFIFACQQMVISGAVATYYFTRDKLALASPIYSSFYNLIRFHLGTVAFGSFVIMAISILKAVVRAMARDNVFCKIIYICCLKPLEDFLKYMTSMGYIVTAIHGQSLCRSSVRAVTLIVGNLLSAVVMNALSSFIFFMVKLVVVLITVGIGLLMKMSAISICIAALAAFISVHTFFVVFEIAVDTIFICYCEDQCMNDGQENPYYTSVDFYKSVRTAQAYQLELEKHKKKKK